MPITAEVRKPTCSECDRWKEQLLYLIQLRVVTGSAHIDRRLAEIRAMLLTHRCDALTQPARGAIRDYLM